MRSTDNKNFKMPSTVANIFTVDSDSSSSVITSARRSSRRSRKDINGRKDVENCNKPTDVRQGTNASQIQSVAKNDIIDKHTSSERNNLTATETNSYVTRRTIPRRTTSTRKHESLVGNRSSNKNIVPDDPHSIIHLDESSIGTKSIAEIVDLTKTCSSNDVIMQASEAAAVSKPRRTSRRISMKLTDSHENSNSLRTASKRKSDNAIAGQDMGVSPPKQALNAALEHSAPVADSSQTSPASEAVTLPTTVRRSINTGTLSTNHSLDKLDNDAFKVLIVSIKRVALPLTETELKSLKYEDKTQNNRLSLRPSSRIKRHPNTGIKVERDTLNRARSTMAKPKIVISSPIVEVPESPPAVAERKRLSHSYLSVSNTARGQVDQFKKPNPTTHPPLPQLIEDEHEDNDDVYEFLSSSQNGDATETKKTTRKPKEKKVRKAAVPSVQNKRQASASKRQPKPVRPKQVNPFGCNNKALLSGIKKLGGGPVKQPATVNYKINLEIPKTPPVASTPVSAEAELPYDDPPASVEVSRSSHPTMDSIKTAKPSFPLTSTPSHRIGMVGGFNAISTQKPASPWRLQDDILLPQTSHTYRTNEMLPSYESFATENNNIGTFVTERRKSPNEGTKSIVPAQEGAPESTMTEQSSEGIVSDKDLREIEQMYTELKATSDMSQKLIKAMRMSKKHPTSAQQNHTMRLACLKLKKWHDRSMKSFNRSMRIISNIQRTTERSAFRPLACPSPLSLEQQRTLNNFNSSTDHFRSMIDQLQLAINDSDVENRPPLTGPLESADTELQGNGKGPVTVLNEVTKSKTSKDVIILPDRGAKGKRNPLMALNVVPLPQRDSPLMSPLAKNPTTGPNNIRRDSMKDATIGENNTRRELQYDKENGFMNVTDVPDVTDKPAQKDIAEVSAITPELPELPEPPIDSVVEINDETTRHECDQNDENAHNSTESIQNSRNYFGFDAGDSVNERSEAQVTLPMPLNISHETLQRRLQNMKQLLPKRPIFRKQLKQQNRSSGPTRFPATKLRVFGSPSKRPNTLREFVASTPRPAGGRSSAEPATAPSKSLLTMDVEVPDVSAIEPLVEPAAVGQNDHDAQTNNEPEVVLFDTPDRPAWLNNSAHQRTYARVPRRKKKNIYLANLGLDDDSEDDENVSDGDPQELSSDSEADEAKRKKKANKRKARRRQPVRVEQTEAFKEFVDNFNSMCEEVERYELIVE
uniref:Protein dalmatian n=1 Tax=Anopheles funestus TaxID=62324 RepID=A0A182RPN7_ANOFN